MKYNNIFWFLLDGLSPMYLNSCGAQNKRNFIDEFISKGTIFSQVYSANAGTHTSMAAFFSGMYSSVNGATGWTTEALRKFNPEIFTITDFFKEAGYNTYRYNDAKGERAAPISGFDVWENSGYLIGKILNNTDNCNCERRKEFIHQVNNDLSNKFVYHHSLLFHELNCQLGLIWTSENYSKNIEITANYFKELIGEYKIDENDLVIVSSDHGVLLDKNYKEAELKEGQRHEEISAVCFWSVQGKDIPKKICNKLISAIDIPNTLIELALDKRFPGQGVSQLGYIYDEEKYIKKPVFREKGSFFTFPQSPNKSDSWVVRDDNFKYVYSKQNDTEWLMDLNEGDYVNNLVMKYPEKVNVYKKMINDTLLKPKDVSDIYKENSFSKKKKDIIPIISVICRLKTYNKLLIDNLLDLAGPYYELLIVTNKNCQRKLKYLQNHPKVKIIHKSKPFINYISGKIILWVDENYIYDEIVLSKCFNLLRLNPELKKVIISDSIYMEKIDYVRNSDLKQLVKKMNLKMKLKNYIKNIININ